jgi:aryl-alcohol dehydrogenase-like predicted oxidoreductase
MMFGAWGKTDHHESIRILHRALDAGINFIDTADVYSRGESEEIVGKALADGRRDNVVLATKVHGTIGDDRTSSATRAAGSRTRWTTVSAGSVPTGSTSTRSTARRPKTASTRRSGAHPPGAGRQGALHRSSTFPASQVVEAQWAAERRGRERFVCEQPPYSLLHRGVELDVLPPCLRFGMGVIPWSPLASGWLSGRWRKDAGNLTSRRSQRCAAQRLSQPENQRKLDAADPFRRLADEAGMTMIELALAFVIRHPAVTAAIIGRRTMEHLESQLTDAEVALSEDVLD